MTATSQEPSPIAAGGDPGVHGARGLLSLWFGTRRVGRGPYLVSGLSLLAIRYVLERAIIQSATGRILSPVAFLTPRWTAYEALLRGAPEISGWMLVALAIPFLWIAVSMSVRRAADAGVSPWLGLLALLPVANIAVVLLLAAMPQNAAPAAGALAAEGRPAARQHLLRGLLAGLLAGLAVLLVIVFALRIYSLALFLCLPVVMGAVAVRVAGRQGAVGPGSAMGLGAAVSLLGGAALLIFALEGALCLAMALPLALLLGMLGGAIGLSLSAAGARPAGSVVAVLALPLLAGVEVLGAHVAPPPLHQVLTSVEIDAPPERVWPAMLAYRELPPTDAWIFRHGIACPTAASLDGAGVGATRRDECSTGICLETITAWEPPCHVTFDIASQPAPMVEWSPWGAIDVPHLHDTLRLRRGEFRLAALPGGRTRLEGRTWYELDMAPLPYWHLWSDALIHRIHRRVLEHVKALTESPP